MYNNVEEARRAYKNGEITIQDLDSLVEVYFKTVSIPAEDTFAIDNWYYDEDEDYDLIVVHNAEAVTRKDLFKNYTLEDLTDPNCDVIDYKGHCLAEEELREIFENMGN